MSLNKILFVLHLPPPVHGASVMGQYIHDSKQINNTFKCFFINLSASVKVEEVGTINLRKIVFFLTNLWNILRFVSRNKPDLCYLTPTSDGWGFYRDFLIVKVLKLFKVKIVLHFHNKSSKYWIAKWYNRLLLKYFFKDLKIILLGRELYAEKSAFIKEKDVFYCPNAIPSKKNYRTYLSSPTQKVKFLFLSNMMKAKGAYVLLEACRMLKQQGYDFQCDFVGAWKDISQVEFNKKMVEYDLVQEVVAHGAKYGEEKSIFFENADIFVFPTFYHGETFGLVLLEAMDYSLPCISTDNGTIKTIINDGETGFCIEQRNTEVLAEKMIWMIENSDERIAMGAKGKKRFDDNFTKEHFENNIVKILTQCLLQ